MNQAEPRSVDLRITDSGAIAIVGSDIAWAGEAIG
jgi:hypothetical protein